MTWPDLVNGSFETVGGMALWGNAARLYRDKRSRGVTSSATAFFMLWGYWNLFYYPSLGQWLSFAGGLNIVTANTVWLALMWRYRNA